MFLAWKANEVITHVRQLNIVSHSIISLETPVPIAEFVCECHPMCMHTVRQRVFSNSPLLTLCYASQRFPLSLFISLSNIMCCPEGSTEPNWCGSNQGDRWVP